MIVLDASAALDLLLHDEASFDWLDRRLGSEEDLAAPHLIDSEVAHVLRRLVLAGRLEAGRAREALHDLDALPLERHPARPLLSRIWELRDTLGGYDATYVALAEALDASLVTSERRLLGLPPAASRATIESVHGTRTPAG